jgi:diguanylate cyclase (GGDEF)-like protein
MQLLSKHFNMGSTPAWRALLAVGAASPSFGVLLLAYGWALASPEIRVGLDTGVVWALEIVMLIGLVINLIAGAYLWPRRASPEAVTKVVLPICLSIGLSFTFMAIAAGVFTSGTGLILLGVMAVGLLLFDLRPMLMVYAVCTLMLLGHDVGVQAGWWAYAPALRPEAFIDGEPAWWLAWWCQFIFIAGFAVFIFLLLLAFASLDRVIGQLSHLSYTDGLTGLANRRRFMEVLATEVARQSRTGQPLCLVLLDADHFKQVNDTHGHHAGDMVLRGLGKLLMGCVRSPIDLACRLGGEEFALILPDTTLAQARTVCMRLREQLAVTHFLEGGDAFRVTVSMGLVQGQGLGVEALMRQADEQLYRAKTQGRDRLCSAEPLQGEA